MIAKLVETEMMSASLDYRPTNSNVSEDPLESEDGVMHLAKMVLDEILSVEGRDYLPEGALL